MTTLSTGLPDSITELSTAGATGSTGLTGPAGPTGPSGPIAVWNALNTYAVNDVVLDTGATPLALYACILAVTSPSPTRPSVDVAGGTPPVGTNWAAL